MQYRKHILVFIAVAVMSIWLLTQLSSVAAQSVQNSAFNRTTTVGFNYVSVYKNRLLNAKAAFDQLQLFFAETIFKPQHQYSFLRDVIHNDIRPQDGYVNTPLGFGYGSCGASSLLNKMVQSATFRDKDGKEEPVFLVINIWTWRGDPTYGKYGATIFLDPTRKHTKDYVWALNPNYTGPSPRLSTKFDMEAETVEITMEYGDAASVSTPTLLKPTNRNTGFITIPHYHINF